MFRVSRAPLRSLFQTLTCKSQCPIHPDLFQYLPPLAARENLNRLAAPFLSYSLYSKSSQEDPHDAISLIDRNPTTLPKLFVVQPRLRPDTVLQAKLDEALNLVYSLEDQRRNSCAKELPPYVVVQNPALRSPRARADTFFGPGTVDTVKCHLNAVESEEEVDAIFVNTILSGVQQRNLERIWDRPVLDRVGLIIEIFNAHAQTKEAKLQAELAALVYKKSRLVRVKGSDGRYTFGAAGEAEVVSARGRGSGGRGFISGAGETELQLQRRRILERRSHLLTQVEEVRRTRAVQRAARKKHGGSHGQGLPTIAVVGYTNAGKSTLVSALSQTHLYSDDRLFATVDPRLRSALLPSGRKVLFSDTVGFISELPVQLVEAFHATLEEVVEADLLVHVLDSCAPNLNEQRSTVLEVLEQIGVSKEKIENMIEVGNKIDLLEKPKCANESLEDGESNSLSEEEDGEAVDLWPAADDQAHGFSEVEDDDDLSSEELVGERIGEYGNGKVCDQSLQDMRKTMDDQERDDDYSDNCDSAKEDWIVNGYSDSTGLKTPERQESASSGPWAIGKQSSSETHYTPHVKTSATRRVGLQELLELVDEKLKAQDEKLMPRKIGGRDIYSKKWRPPHANDAEIAVEQ